VTNLGVMVLITGAETVPFHFIWVSLSLVYGFRLWSLRSTVIVLLATSAATGAALLWAVTRTADGPGLDELNEVPLMAAMFVAMVWHARRRQAALEEVQRLADTEHRLLGRQKDFVWDASHMLKTPITVARGHAELIRAEGSSQVAADAEVVMDELKRLGRIAERLVTLAASEQPDFLRPAPVEIPSFLRDSARRWRPTANRRWEVRPGAGGTILADRDRLELALDALIENAVKFTREGDRISLGVRPGGGGWVIEVTDTGEGIGSEDLGRLFDRYSRGRAARRDGGAGLGLAIVKAIAAAHGGSVSVESEAGKGSTFGICLPADPGSVAAT